MSSQLPSLMNCCMARTAWDWAPSKARTRGSIDLRGRSNRTPWRSLAACSR